MVTLSCDTAFPGAGAYAAAKSSLYGLTRVLAHELVPVGIPSNVVVPGFTLTERNLQIMTQHAGGCCPEHRLPRLGGQSTCERRPGSRQRWLHYDSRIVGIAGLIKRVRKS
jgi:NAD(P)-dependent dehydrogenase (short-subunit alcohol dehydrogenase family)